MTDLAALDFVEADVAVGPLTTYKLGGPASFYAEVSDRPQLDQVLEAWRESGVPLLVLGRGSNLVVADDGIDALVLRLAGQFGDIVHEPTSVVAGSVRDSAFKAAWTSSWIAFACRGFWPVQTTK